MDIHGNVHGGGSGGGDGSGRIRNRGRCRVVVMAAGPWTLDRPIAPEAQLRDARVEVMGAMFNDQSRDRAAARHGTPTNIALFSPSPSMMMTMIAPAVSDDDKENDDEEWRREEGSTKLMDDTASPLVTPVKNPIDDKDDGEGGLAAFAAAVNGRDGDVLQLGRGGGGYGTSFNFDFNFRAALVGSKLVSSDCPERMRESWRACFGVGEYDHPCPDLGGEEEEEEDDDGFISPLDDFSMLSLKYSFEQGDEDEDEDGGAGAGEGSEGGKGGRRREASAGESSIRKAARTTGLGKFAGFGSITVGTPPRATAAGGGGGLGADLVMSEMERAAARRLGVQLHREACKSLKSGGGVAQGDRATAAATTGRGGSEENTDGGGGGGGGGGGEGEGGTSSRSSPGGKPPGGGGGGGGGGKSPSSGIPGGCRGASRALNERGVTLGFAEVKVVLHDSSTDAGLVSVETGLEPAQLHHVLVALVTPIAVVHVGRLAKSGGFLRPTKRNGALALHVAAGGAKLTWLGEPTVPGAAAASLGMRAEVGEAVQLLNPVYP
jgi:hypothetical protein